MYAGGWIPLGRAPSVLRSRGCAAATRYLWGMRTASSRRICHAVSVMQQTREQTSFIWKRASSLQVHASQCGYRAK